MCAVQVEERKVVVGRRRVQRGEDIAEQRAELSVSRRSAASAVGGVLHQEQHFRQRDAVGVRSERGLVEFRSLRQRPLGIRVERNGRARQADRGREPRRQRVVMTQGGDPHQGIQLLVIAGSEHRNHRAADLDAGQIHLRAGFGEEFEDLETDFEGVLDLLLDEIGGEILNFGDRRLDRQERELQRLEDVADELADVVQSGARVGRDVGEAEHRQQVAVDVTVADVVIEVRIVELLVPDERVIANWLVLLYLIISESGVATPMMLWCDVFQRFDK